MVKEGDVFPEANKIEEISKGLKPGEVFDGASEAPIEAGTIFDPEEELKEVLKVVGKEREVKFTEYKDKYAYQKEGLAKMQGAIRERIIEHPEISEEELFTVAGGFAATYGLPVDQLREAAAAIKGYAEQHKIVQETISRFATEKDGHPATDTEAFFRAAFFENPVGKVEVFAAPTVIYFRCYDPQDFYQIVKIQMNLRGNDPVPAEAMKIRGVLLNKPRIEVKKCLLAEIDGMVAAENFSLVLKDAEAAGGSEEDVRTRVKNETEAIFLHEEQHSVQGIFDDPIGATMKEWEEIAGAETEEQKEMALRRFMREERKIMEARAKGEMLAYLTGQMHEENGAKMLEAGKNYFRRGGIYDYYPGHAKKTKEFLMARMDKKDEQLAAGQTEKILGEEYEELVNKGIDALGRLLSGNYSKDSRMRARHLLSAVPLRRWPREVDRFLKV